MKLTGELFTRVTETLREVFYSPEKLDDFLREHFNERLDSFSSPKESQPTIIKAVADWFASEDKLSDFIAVAAKVSANQRLPDLLKFVDAWERLSKQHSQSVIQNSRLYAEQSKFTENLLSIGSRVCLIEIPIENSNDHMAVGTGFLVGPDLVLTNYHVVQYLFDIEARKKKKKDWALPEHVSINFDFLHTEETGEIRKPAQYQLKKTNWCVDSSKPTWEELEDREKINEPGDEELDYALVRLSKKAGMDPVPGAERPRVRGWIEIPEGGIGYDKNAPMLMLQYPGGTLLRFLYEPNSQQTLNKSKTRLTYSARTDYGSSGAPCFTENWELIAIHRARSLHDSQNPDLREGIPMTAVASLLRKRKRLPSQIHAVEAENLVDQKNPSNVEKRLRSIEDYLLWIEQNFKQAPIKKLREIMNQYKIQKRSTQLSTVQRVLDPLLNEHHGQQDTKAWWAFVCLELHVQLLGVMTMPKNFRISISDSLTPYGFIKFLYDVKASFEGNMELLEKHHEKLKNPELSSIRANIVQEARGCLKNIEQEVEGLAELLADYNLMIAADFGGQRQQIKTCLRRTDSALKKARSLSAGEFKYSVRVGSNLSRLLEELKDHAFAYDSWLKELTTEAIQSLGNHFSKN